MNVPAIFRLVSNGSRYAIQRKGGVMEDWRLCGCMVPTSDFTAIFVPYIYMFKWMARWKMCKLMVEEHEQQKSSNQTWTEVTE